jgi:hypothetical protein
MRELIKFRNIKKGDCATVAERCRFTVSDVRLLFVASYVSRSNCGGIRPRLHTVIYLAYIKGKGTLRLTVSQTVSLGVETHLVLMTRYLLPFTVLFLWVTLSDERTGLSFVYAAGHCLVSGSLGTSGYVLLSQI